MKLKIAWWLSSQSKAAWSVISELIPLKWDYSDTGRLQEACNPWRHQHQRKEGFPHKKQINSHLGCPWDLCWIWEHHQWWKVWMKPRVTVERPSHCIQVHTAGAFPCQSYSLCFSPHSAGPVTGKKHRKGKKGSLCYYGNLRVIFRDRIFLGIINRHEQDLC